MCDKGWRLNRIRSLVIIFSTNKRVLIWFEDVSGVRAGYYRHIRFFVYGSIVQLVTPCMCN